MKKYPRKCDVTGKGMNEGWIDEGSSSGKEYFKKKKHILKHVKSIMKKEGAVDPKTLSDDDILEYGYNHYSIYWTEWGQPEDDENYFDKNGNEYVLCHKCGEQTLILENFNMCQHCLTNL